MFTANQLVAHLIGDYVIQSDWMANNKTKKWSAIIAHVVLYTACFVPLVLGMPLERAVLALAIIGGTHGVIDRYRLARYVIWFRNFLSPPGSNPSWEECSGTGFPPDRPAWLVTWLLIFTDNVMHVVINGATLYLLENL